MPFKMSFHTIYHPSYVAYLERGEMYIHPILKVSSSVLKIFQNVSGGYLELNTTLVSPGSIQPC